MQKNNKHDKELDLYERNKTVINEALIHFKKIYIEQKLNEVVKSSKNLFLSKRNKISSFIADVYSNPRKFIKNIEWKKFGQKKIKINGISVIIPTYRDNHFFYECIESVKNQSLDKHKIEIIISVNGSEIEYFEKLSQLYKLEDNIKVIYTVNASASAGRNNGLKFVNKDYLIFLDDDDYFSIGYLEELLQNLESDTSIVCGKVNELENNTLIDTTYINEVIRKFSNKKTKDYFKIGSLFSSPWGKLLRTSMVKSFLEFNEDYTENEDIIYWVDNFNKLEDYVKIVDIKSNEFMVRRLTKNSLSRPCQESLMNFYVFNRLKLFKHLNDKIFDSNLSLIHKRFIINKIRTQTALMEKFYNKQDENNKKDIEEAINKEKLFYLNCSKFSRIKGIAFTHNFSPWADASAYVATKRLSEIENIECKKINWDIVSANMSNIREKDFLYDMFFTDFVINKRIEINMKSYFNEKHQYNFAVKAFDSVKDKKADIIYSRSMFVGSHTAAYFYKQKYPNVKWYAEFSDPIYYGTDNKKRPVVKEYKNNESFLNSYWKDVEEIVYEHADYVIFTNENQKTYMFDYCENKKLVKIAQKKAFVLEHPKLDKKFVNILNSEYQINKEKINIAYFGTFYKNRNFKDIENLLIRDDINLHLFIQSNSELYERKNLFINSFVSYFEFINIASKMDYLLINDIDFIGPINPYLPSKLSDYLVTDTKIIAKICNNSILSDISHPHIIKTVLIDKEFVNTIKKE